MPQLSELIQKKKFIKKRYRPWDLSGSGSLDHTDEVVLSSPIPTPDTLVEENATPTVQNNDNNRITDNETGNDLVNESDNKQITNRQQTDNKRITTGNELDNNEITKREQLDNKIDNEKDNAEDINHLVDKIKKLSGIQQTIFVNILDLCSARGTMNTGNILSSELSYSAKCSNGSAKTSLDRLIKKGLLIRGQGKSSRGGHMVLGITKEIRSAAIQAQRSLFNPFRVQLGNKSGNITDNEGTYSSSSKNNNNTTTTLSEDWKKINYDNVKNIGFTETQLRQLFECNVTSSEVIQSSINHFAYALEHNEKVKAYNEPLNVLMGVLRKGNRWHEPNYISPSELALKQIIEEKKVEKEQNDALIKELVDLEFPNWRNKLKENEIKKIVPPEITKANIPAAITSSLRKHYIEIILKPRLRDQGIEIY